MLSLFYGLHSSEGNGNREKYQQVSTNSGPMLYCRVSTTQAADPGLNLPHQPYVPVADVPLSSGYLSLCLTVGSVCGVMVAGSTLPSTLHKAVSLR